MPFLLVGVNHKTCPLDIREQFFLQPQEKELLLSELKNDPRVLAAFVLSTCNRTEIYTDLIDADPSSILKTFFSVKHLSLSHEMEKYFYILRDENVVSHLFRVVTGLDSMILGEKQILGQVKGAVDSSREKQLLNRAFNILSHMAIETGRKIRRETHIDFGGSSISWAAVVKAQEILGTLEGKSVLLLGAGKMGFMASEQLKSRGVKKILVMNRTPEKAEEMAQQCGGTAVHFWQMKEALEEVDVCICSTGAPHYLVDRDLMEQVMARRSGRALALIDIGVPRNIEPHVAAVKGVVLLSVDELSQTLEDNMSKRQNAAKQAEKIITAKVNEFHQAMNKAAMAELLRASGNQKEAYIP